ncbi:MAG TPA: hypothetical protein DCW35_04040 [Polynucleobacter sp.]|nr:hypothetical protein [Polynucleobacter sp.]
MSYLIKKRPVPPSTNKGVTTRNIEQGSYPALVDRGDFCDLEVFDDLEEARKQQALGLRRLFALGNKDTLKALQKQLPGIRELGLLYVLISG